MRPRRAPRGALGRGGDHEEVEDEEQLIEEEAPRPRRGRRAGKAPVEETEDEDYQPGADEEEDYAATRPQRGALAGIRRSLDGGGEDDGGPSQKRGRRGNVGAAAAAAGVKAEPNGHTPGLGQRRGAAGRSGGGGGALGVSAGDQRKLEELFAAYKRLRDDAAEKAAGKAPAMAMQAASRAVARHVIFAHTEKPGVPVKRTELVAVVTARFPNVKSKAPVTAFVIAHAQHYLVDSMGMEMQMVHRRNLQETAAEEGSQQYVLRSVVPAQLRTAFVLDRSQDSERALLVVVLGLLSLADGKLPEDDLFTQLAELGISRGDAHHPVFGQVAVHLKEFCTRRYIQQEKQQGPDGEVIVYRFAEQAEGNDAEIGQAAIERLMLAEYFKDGDGGAE